MPLSDQLAFGCTQVLLLGQKKYALASIIYFYMCYIDLLFYPKKFKGKTYSFISVLLIRMLFFFYHGDFSFVKD